MNYLYMQIKFNNKAKDMCIPFNSNTWNEWIVDWVAVLHKLQAASSHHSEAKAQLQKHPQSLISSQQQRCTLTSGRGPCFRFHRRRRRRRRCRRRRRARRSAGTRASRVITVLLDFPYDLPTLSHLHTCVPACLPACPTCLPAYLPTNLSVRACVRPPNPPAGTRARVPPPSPRPRPPPRLCRRRRCLCRRRPQRRRGRTARARGRPAHAGTPAAGR